MKKFCLRKVLVISFISSMLIILSGDVVQADTGNYYQSKNFTKCNKVSGGSFYSFTERHKKGKVSGNVATYPYYLYVKYTGKATVKSVKAVWKLSSNLKNSASMSLGANVGVGATSTVGTTASSSNSWQWKEVSKYYISTNGSKVVYSKSQFTVSPKNYVDKKSISIRTEGYLKLKGDNQPYEAQSGC